MKSYNKKILFTILLLVFPSFTYAAQICDVPFDNNSTDSLGACTTTTAGQTYISGHTGNAARTSHNLDDGNDTDLTTSFTIPATNEIYISRWVKYEENYWGLGSGCSSIWNVKQFWIDVDSSGSTDMEMAIQGYNTQTNQATWYIQHGGVFSTASHYDSFPYNFGDWMHIEIYMKVALGTNATNVWVKINDSEIANYSITSSALWAGATLRSPGIKASCDCNTGEGWWQIDDLEVWDGMPNETSDTTAPAAPNELSVN